MQPRAEQLVRGAEQRTVAHRIVRPWQPARMARDHRWFGVAVALRDAEGSAMIERAVPGGLRAEGEDDGDAQRQAHGEQAREEGRVAAAPGAIGRGERVGALARHAGSCRLVSVRHWPWRRRYVRVTCVGSSFKNLAISWMKPRKYTDAGSSPKRSSSIAWSWTWLILV